MLPETIAHHIACIYNAAYMVRACRVIQREQRSKAIQDMGFVVRKAFNASDNFEPLLTAVVVGLSRSDDPPF